MILLEVEFAPQIKARRPKVAQAIDFEIELICRVEAYPPPAISWIRNDKQLNNNEEYQISHLATVNEVTESTLKLTRVEKHHYGDYWCKASNKVGNAETRINLFGELIVFSFIEILIIIFYNLNTSFIYNLFIYLLL